MIRAIACLAVLVAPTVTVTAFTPTQAFVRSSVPLKMGTESEVDFGDLDGSDIRVGIIRTRWNDKHVTNLVDGAMEALKECNVKEENIFQTEVPGAFELPLAASLLIKSGTVDAVITAGVLIKGETLHFEYISDAVSKGIMNIGIQSSLPVVYGVLNCLNEEQVIKRSTGDNNHGKDWGKTAVEMALLRNEALNVAGGVKKPSGMGFGKSEPVDAKEGSDDKGKVGFF